MIALTLISALALGQAAPEQTLRRFALFAGANDGGRGRVTLRYAAADARAMAKVMTALGGVDPRDVVELEDPSVAELSTAFDALAGRLKQAAAEHVRVEVFFYYSGHSDEDGLLLKGARLAYADLRKRLDGLPADVRIAVLDSCASGALTLLKGGAPRPSFLVDASSSLSGHAFLTSASADEAAQESERLKASIFTHYFLSGLRGAADSSRDGRVTLTEAYQYAFAQTLARTTSTQAGPQRPGYDIQLVGTGDLVLTDLRASSARVVLDADLSGRVYVLGADGSLVVEVAKAAGKPVELGLEPGQYKLVLDEGGKQVAQAQLDLGAQSSRTLTRDGLTRSEIEPTVLRGDEPRPHLYGDVSFVPPLSFAGFFGRPPLVNFELGVVASRVGALEGLMISSAVGWVDDDARGVAVTGGFLRAGSLTGIGVTGGLLISSGNTLGVTAAPLVISGGDLVGLHTNVASLALGEEYGLQLSALNLGLGGVRGGQVATVAWAADHMTGAQLGVVDVVTGRATGLQLGVLNIGGTVTGAQIGLVNIASAVHGLQLGLLNIAQTSDAPVGLLNIITKGEFHLTAWTNETSVANAALKIGGEHVYSLLTLGFNPRGSMHPSWSYGLGLGVRNRWGSWYGELEAGAESLHELGGPWNEEQVLSTGLRLNVGYQVFKGVAVFAGPQLFTVIGLGTSQVSGLAPWGYDLSGRVKLVPGFVLGAQFL